jgi:hypothetical protein
MSISLSACLTGMNKNAFNILDDTCNLIKYSMILNYCRGFRGLYTFQIGSNKIKLLIKCESVTQEILLHLVQIFRMLNNFNMRAFRST